MTRGLEQRAEAPITEAAVHQEIAERLANKKRLTIGFIPDGGRRGGESLFQTLDAFTAHKFGHREGAKRAIELGKHARKHLPPINLVVWGLSVYNQERTQEELNDDLLPLLSEVTTVATNDAVQHGERIIHLGRKEPLYDSKGDLLVPGLPNELKEKLIMAEELTKGNGGPILAVAINYLGDDEMTRIYDRFQAAKAENAKNPEKGIPHNTPFTRDTWRKYGDDGGMLGDITTVIRTAGGSRFSNFGWRAGNSELRVIEKYVTEVTPFDVEQALLDSLRTEQKHGK